jgi:Ras-related protein Rab-2A
MNISGWDTAGTESFRAITRSYYRGAAGCLLVYDVTNRKSRLPVRNSDSCSYFLQGFENIRQWLADVRDHADPHVSCILVGNKVDLCESAPAPNDVSGPSSSPPSGSQFKSTKGSKGKARAVSYEEAASFAKSEGLLFVEASAKSGVNVEQAFVDASVDILEKIKKGVFDDNRVRRIFQTFCFSSHLF